jgi:hypothetical protein
MADGTTSLMFRLLGDSSDAEAAFSNVEESADGTESKLKKFGVAAGAAGAAAGGLLAAQFMANMDIEASNAKLAGQLGLTTAASAIAGEAAGEVYRQNWGESIDDVNLAIRSVGTNIGEIGEMSKTELEGMTSKALALSTTFDVDLAGSTEAVGAMLKNGMAGSADEAFDILTAGMQSGANKADDLLETFTEYSPQLSKLGLDGAQAMSFIRSGLQGGARDSDVLMDALKEFSLVTIDGTTEAAGGYKALGLNAKATSAAIAAGGPGASAALNQIIDGLMAMKDPVKQNAAGVAFFGTTWEDTVRQALPSLAGFSQRTGDVTGATQKMMDTVGDTGAGRIETMKRAFEGWTQKMTESHGTLGLLVAGGTTFGGTALAMGSQIGMIVSGMASLNVASMGARVAQLASAAATGVATAAQWLWNIALSANPIGIIIIAIAALVAGLIWFFTKTELGRQIFSAAMEGIRISIGWVVDKAQMLWNWAKDNWPLLLAIFTGPIGLAVKFITDKWDGIVAYVKALPGKITSGASGMWNGIWNGFRGVLNKIISGWNSLHFSVPSFSFAGLTTPGFNLGLPKLPMLAKGGIINGPTALIAGEAGREMITPLDDGPIGGNLTINVTAGAVGSESYLAEVIAEAVRRGSSLGYGTSQLGGAFA